MGWLEGVLTGYAKRHYEIEDQKRKEAGDAAEREGRVFETLLNSPYKDIREYASAGILDLSNPRRRKGGVAGWMGEVETTPYLDMIRRTQQRLNEEPDYADANRVKSYYPWLGQSGGPDVVPDPGTPGAEQGGTPPATPSIPTPAGQVAPAAPGAPPAALPSTSPVTHPGSVTPVTPAPQVSAPPAPPGAGAPPSLNFNDYLRAGGPSAAPPAPPGGPAAPPAAAAAAQQAPGAAPAGPPVPPGGPAPLPPGGPPPVSAAAAPAPAPPPPPPSTGLVAPGMPGATTQAVGATGTPIPQRTQLPGIFPTQSDTQREQARATVQGKIEGYAEMYRAQGFPEAQAYAKAAKLFEQDLLNTGSGGGLGQTYASGPITPDPTSPTGYSQVMYHRQDPTRQIRIPSQAPSGRNTLIAGYQRQWNAIQAPVRAMEINLRTMESSYKRYMAGDETAWEPLRTAFVHVSEPNSVVMPSEFARAAGVLGLRDQIWGWLEQKRVGGGVLDKNEVRNLMATAIAIWQGASTYGSQQRSAIEAAIDRPDLQIPHEAVFGSEDRYNPNVDTSDTAGPGPAGTATNPPPGATPPAPGATPTPAAAPAPTPGAGGGAFHLENGKWVWK